MQTSLFSWRLFIRIIAILAIASVFTYTIINSFVISRDNESIQNHQLETLTKLLITQSALSASDIMVNEDQDAMLKLANQIASDRLVYDATLYNAQGVMLVASDNAKTARDILGLDTPLKTASIGREQLVKPVFSHDSMIGFLRITFEKGKVTAISDHHYRNSDHLMFMMLILSFFSGAVLCWLLLYKPKDHVENILLKDL